jgi:glycosyltransferase involved in cell wall biosynthesis
MINANSPQNEESVIKKYMEKYPNIIYLKLDHDPGLYAVWNMAIKMSQGEYITNANLDDRLKIDCYEVHAKELDKSIDIDLVYSGCYKSIVPNEVFENNDHCRVVPHSQYNFSQKKLVEKLMCYPNNHPMWRKSIHYEYGLFNEKYVSAGDLEMWLRAAGFGNSKVKKIKGFYALYYVNPNGLSTSKETLDEKERAMIRDEYRVEFEEFINREKLKKMHRKSQLKRK